MRRSKFSLLWRFITLAHGAGGRETKEVIEELIKQHVPVEYWKVQGGTGLDELDDSSLIPLGDGRYLAITIDSYTVNPPFFPGGNIGLLAASGTINDLLMVGAKPLAALDAIIVEEGFPSDKLEAIIESLTKTLTSEGVKLIGGDFKVMPRGQVDGIVIAMTGIGITSKPIIDSRIKPGDVIIVTGSLGDHGAAILAAQQGLTAKLDVKSDVKPLTKLMIPLLERYGDAIHGAGDPTRGGLAMLVNDWAEKTGTVIVLHEDRIPVKKKVRDYAEMLGIDPLSLASEGVAVLAVDEAYGTEILEYIRSKGFEEAEIIGRVYEAKKPEHKGKVLLRTITGGYRILEPPSGELVPRIC